MAPRATLAQFAQHKLVSGLYLTDVGYFPHADHHYRTRRNGCDQYILIFCVKGRGFVKLFGDSHDIGEGTVLVIPPGVGHTYGAITDDPWYIYWVHFTGENASCYLPSDPRVNLLFSPTDFRQRSTLINLFTSIFDSFQTGVTLSSVIYSSQVLSHILAELYYFESPSETRGLAGRRSRYVREAIAYLNQHLSREVTLQELASIVHLSKSQLSLVFKRDTGYSPIDFFTRLKIQQACQYLDLTDLTIAEIANKLGYKDPYYFSRCFTRIMGVPPAKYRRVKKG